jgi:RNA 3'-terminal phosphate cyclase (ATP)
VTPGKYHFSIGTAGATSLVLHTLYLPLALCAKAPSEITITGGTHVPHSPSFHFLDTTWRAYMQLLGLRVGVRMRRPGFYPRGGGILEADIEPCAKVNGLCLGEVPRVKKATGFSAVAGLPEDIARRQARRAGYRLREAGLHVDLALESWPGGPGSVLAVILPAAPVPALFCGLGQRGKPAERVADEAVEEVIAHLHAEPRGIDAHSADQLLLPLALAQDPSRFGVAQVTQHLLTNMAVIRLFVDREMTCEGREGSAGTVHLHAKPPAPGIEK